MHLFCLNMYRGITLSSVVSKLFELVLLDYFEAFLASDDLQFGFKKKSTVAVIMHCLHLLNQ